MTDKEKELILMDVISVIKKGGLKVYVPADEAHHTYAYITDGKNIGYVQYDIYDGISFTSEHIPCKEHGGGFRVGNMPCGTDGYDEIQRLARRSLDNNPEIKQWFSRYKVEKYKDWQDFESRHWCKLQQI